MEWIRTKDKMPTDHDEVILFHPFKKIDGKQEIIIFVGYWDELNDEWVCGWYGMFPPCEDNYTQSFIDENFRLKKSEVIYWMPLPMPPNLIK